jgi:hypothetical protein
MVYAAISVHLLYRVDHMPTLQARKGKVARIYQLVLVCIACSGARDPLVPLVINGRAVSAGRRA